MTAASNQTPASSAVGVPWWGWASAAAAPIVLVADWTIAAWLQHRPYDAMRETFSVLAAHGAADRWVATLAFVVVGTLDVVTACALRPAAWAGRILLAAGGVSGLLIAVNPETIGPAWSVVSDSSLRLHELFGALGLVALTIWPVLAARRGEPVPGNSVPWALRPGPALAASALTTAMLGWFLIELVTLGSVLGVVERALGEVQALWPLIVVVSCPVLVSRRHPVLSLLLPTR